MPNLFEQFAVLTPAMALEGRELTTDFYEALERDYDGFGGHVLVSAYHFDRDWPTWEKHPAGDEMVVLLSGTAELVLRGEDGDEVVALTRAGEYLCVPSGTWHTARIADAAQLLFITPGEGTENATLPA